MASTPAALGRRYLPFIALAAVQVLLVALVPSRGPGKGTQVASSSYGAGAEAGGAGGGPTGDTASGTATAGSSGLAATAGGGTANVGTTGGGGTAGATGGGPAAAGGTVASKTAAPAAAADDLSHCDKNGRQIGPPAYIYMPPCVPVWHGTDNGGATMTGVDATHINFVIYKPQGNAQVNQLLATQDLAASPEQYCEALESWTAVINKHWERYGRTFTSLDGPDKNKGSTQDGQNNCHFPYFQGQCTLTPPDPPCEQAEAKVIAAMKPAFVLAGGADTSLYEELTKDHIIVIGPGVAPESYFDESAPYLYGLLMDGTRQAQFTSEYWCKRLNGKPASFAGPDVKTSRNWGTAPGAVPVRKIGVIFPLNNGDNVIKDSVDDFKARITGGKSGGCNSPGGVLEISYASDINTAQQQAGNIVQQLIANHITTVLCWCDPIAPAFLTQNEKAQGYFPEQFINGSELMDYDQLGRLYDPQEWQYAFGVSQLALPTAFQNSDAMHWWQDAGRPGQPDKTENGVIPFFSVMATAIQVAGPQPTPEKIAHGMQTLAPMGGWAQTHDQHQPLIAFNGSSPWTILKDTREVYWSQTRPSEVDGKPGSYCPVDGGHRYNLGEWPGGDPAVFDQAKNGC